MFYERQNGYGIKLDEYEGKYKLIAARQKEDKVYMDWVFLSKWDDGGFIPDEKKRPMGVYLGTREEAVSVLSKIISELNGGETGNDTPF